jgi:hypothetical protein
VGSHLPKGWKSHNFNSISWSCPSDFKNISNEQQSIFSNGIDTISILDKTKKPFPISLTHQFRNAFYAYHYNSFFDKVYLDSKVKKIFRDSVTILDVVPKTTGLDLMFSCENCNVVATLKFKKKVFYFPVQMADNVLELSSQFTFNLDDPNKTAFRSLNEDHKGGVYFGHSPNSALLLDCPSCTEETMNKILESAAFIISE